MKMEQSVPKRRQKTPGNHPKERIRHSQHGEGLKSGMTPTCFGYLSFPSSGSEYRTKVIYSRNITLLIAKFVKFAPFKETSVLVQGQTDMEDGTIT